MTAHTLPGSITTPSFYRSAPLLNPYPYVRLVPGLAPDATGQPITTLPPGPGQTSGSLPVVTGSPVKRGSGTGFSYAALNGTSDAISSSTTSASQATSTIMVVARLKSTSGFQTIFYNGPSGANRWDLSVFEATNRLRFVYSSSDTTLATHPWVPDTDWHVFTVTRTPTAVNIGVDLQFKSTAGISTDSTLTGNAFRIGQRRGGGSTGQQIDVAEAILFPTLSVSEYRIAEVKNLMSYYGLRWGDDVSP